MNMEMASAQGSYCENELYAQLLETVGCLIMTIEHFS